jgi:hypothetical protein
MLVINLVVHDVSSEKAKTIISSDKHNLILDEIKKNKENSKFYGKLIRKILTLELMSQPCRIILILLWI